MRIALGVSYNGHGYFGWQSQLSGNTVQDRLEAALGRFATVPVSTLCAGRTDSGVHGLMQVVHFNAPVDRTPASWVRGTNAFLPSDIAVQWARCVPDAFHARASATARRYAYVLLQSPVRPSVETGRVGWVFRPLDGEAMRAAAAHLLGEHDFTSFRASACQALLHHMIRNIMGCLVAVGQGAQAPQWVAQVLAARSRKVAAPTFSPDGLYFLGPVYDEQWGLPTRTAAYDALP